MTYEEQYLSNLKHILQNGVKEKNARTGVVTRRIPATIMTIDVSKELPILTSKKVAWKTAIEEMIWIYLKGSSDSNELSTDIWKKNAYPDGSIGKSYGYQAGKSVKVFVTNPETKEKELVTYKNQLDYVINTLKNDKTNRQAILNLWDCEELSEMALPPCLLSSCWTIIDNKLNVLLTQRSADYPLGVPFDTFEYGVLMHLVARELGCELGQLTHVFSDSHIYENQVSVVESYLETAELHTPPTIKIADKPLYELTVEDFELVNYEHGAFLKLPLN